MSGWDKNQVYTAGQRVREVGYNDQFTASEYLNDRRILESKFFEFVYNFQSQQGGFKYRDQLISNLKVEYYGLDIDFRDLVTYDESLSQHLKDYPTQFLDSFELAIEACAQRIVSTSNDEELSHDLLENSPSFQAVLKSLDTIDNLHQLTAESVSKLINVTGVIVSASSLTLKATTLHLRCKNCGHTKRLSVARGLNGISVPRSCDNPNKDNNTDKCPIDPFDVDFTQSKSVDQQLLKLQECPDNVEPGELPKHLLLSADRCLVNQVVPGTRTSVIGVYSTFQSGASQGNITRNPYIRVVGFSSETLGIRTQLRFEDAEMKEMEAMARTPNFIDRFCSSIAPAIYGNQNMKIAVACLLLGGSTKILPDGMRLRGDINVLMLGDPSTAKSQLLKFAEKVAPVAVYTSGKGSSAAGLTASVVREAGSREFYLEGGAMVLADGGIVCIDEFDKMRDEDRVAIHEAMEQQTISIAKAGITTVLNARSSVLAAANPIFGRYNDLKSAGDNIDFQTTILSRFDLIFIVKDQNDRKRDAIIAKHVMDIHLQQDLNYSNELDTNQGLEEGIIPPEIMQKFISYAKVRVQPRLTEAASQMLVGEFVDLRQKVKQMEVDTDQRSAIPMTIRQLEAIIRLSESFARMQLTSQADESHVQLAMQLFKNSTFEAVKSHEKQYVKGVGSLSALIKEAENQIRNRMKPGNTVLVETIVKELAQLNFTDDVVHKCILGLVNNETLQYRNNKNSVYRPFN